MVFVLQYYINIQKWSWSAKGGTILSGTRWKDVCKTRAIRIGGWKCEDCGVRLTESKAQGHHIWPKSLFGQNEVENCRIRCAKCEQKDKHWISARREFVLVLLRENRLAELSRAMPPGLARSLPQPLRYYRRLVLDRIERPEVCTNSQSNRDFDKANQLVSAFKAKHGISDTISQVMNDVGLSGRSRFATTYS